MKLLTLISLASTRYGLSQLGKHRIMGLEDSNAQRVFFYQPLLKSATNFSGLEPVTSRLGSWPREPTNLTRVKNCKLLDRLYSAINGITASLLTLLFSVHLCKYRSFPYALLVLGRCLDGIRRFLFSSFFGATRRKPKPISRHLPRVEIIY